MITLGFSIYQDFFCMLLDEFDHIIDRMQLAFEYATNLGQLIDAAKILYQMNEQLPDDLQIAFDDMEDVTLVKKFVQEYSPMIKSAISEYRQRLMIC